MCNIVTSECLYFQVHVRPARHTVTSAVPQVSHTATPSPSYAPRAASSSAPVVAGRAVDTRPSGVRLPSNALFILVFVKHCYNKQNTLRK